MTEKIKAEVQTPIPTAPAYWVAFGSVRQVLVLCPYCGNKEWHKAPVENGAVR